MSANVSLIIEILWILWSYIEVLNLKMFIIFTSIDKHSWMPWIAYLWMVSFLKNKRRKQLFSAFMIYFYLWAWLICISYVLKKWERTQIIIFHKYWIQSNQLRNTFVSIINYLCKFKYFRSILGLMIGSNKKISSCNLYLAILVGGGGWSSIIILHFHLINISIIWNLCWDLPQNIP